MAIDVLVKNNKANNIDINSVNVNFKYIDRTNNGLQSMFVVCIDSNNFYFNISNDKMQLLSDNAKDFFDL